jgi:hypothetical protein
MLAAVVIALTMFTGQAKAAGVALPDTPQGKQVEAWLKAFNSGDEKVFMKAQEELMAPAVLARRSPEERAKLFQRLKGDFGTMKLEKVIKATAQQIVIQVPTQDGATGTFTFDFEDKAPFKITGLGVDVQAGGGV